MLHGLGDACHDVCLAGLAGSVHGALAFAFGLEGGLGLVSGGVWLGLGRAFDGLGVHLVLHFLFDGTDVHLRNGCDTVEVERFINGPPEQGAMVECCSEHEHDHVLHAGGRCCGRAHCALKGVVVEARAQLKNGDQGLVVRLAGERQDDAVCSLLR
ncbi:hypothetical protein D3C71_1717370 [compost metagenome]